MNKKQKRVLIVDDDQLFAKEMSEMLADKNYITLVCDKVENAISDAEKYRPDIILLDINLGGIDGYQLAEAFRKDIQLTDVPIIAMSAYFERRPYEVIGAHYGIQAFMAKPFKATDIISCIETLTLPNDGRCFFHEDLSIL